MSRRLAWAGLAAAGTALEVASLRRHDGATLSETTRALYRTHTPLGRLLFVASWTGLSVWLVPHICRATAAGLTAAAETISTAIEEATP